MRLSRPVEAHVLATAFRPFRVQLAPRGLSAERADWNATITALGRKRHWRSALATAEDMRFRCATLSDVVAFGGIRSLGITLPLAPSLQPVPVAHNQARATVRSLQAQF